MSSTSDEAFSNSEDDFFPLVENDDENFHTPFFNLPFGDYTLIISSVNSTG